MKNPAGKAERVRKAKERRRQRRERWRQRPKYRGGPTLDERREFAERMGRFDYAISKDEPAEPSTTD